MKLKFIILFLLIATISFSQDEKGKVDVMMKMLTLKNALIAKDSITLSKVLADDVTYGHTTALMQTKAELIRSVVSMEQDYKSIEPSDLKVRIYENSAVVTMNAKVSMFFQKQPLDLNMRATFIWIKKNKDWQLVARQAVRVN